MTSQAIFAICIWLLAFVTTVIVFRTPASLAAGLIFGWLFLPNFTVSSLGLPDWDKAILVSVVSTGLMLAVPSCDRSGMRFSWMDLPALGVTLFSIPASVSNGLGLYDGLSAAYWNFWVWTAPYLIGRRVFGSHANATVLIRITILGGFIYAAFCLYEIKMSPRLHWIIYGMLPREGQNYFTQAVRYGMWRPTVFMEHGLALAILMSITSTLAWWAHVSGAISRMSGMSMRTVACILGLTTLLCVSSGAIVLMALGWAIVALRGGKLGRVSLLIAALIPFVYPVSRMLGSGVLVNAVVAVSEVAANQTGEDRTDSFQIRVDNEERLLRTWQSSPLFGKARYFTDVEDTDRVITDAYWIIMLGKMGICGWLCWTSLLALPAMIVAFRKGFWSSNQTTTAVGLSLAAVIFAFDCLFNAMPNSVFVVTSGAAVGLLRHGPMLNDDADHSNARNTTVSPRVARSMWPPTGH